MLEIISFKQVRILSHRIKFPRKCRIFSVIHKTARTAKNCTKCKKCDWFLSSQCFSFTKTFAQKGAITFQIRAKIACRCSRKLRIRVIQNEKENMSTIFLIHKFPFRENPLWRFSTHISQRDRNSDASRCVSFNFWLRTRQNNMRFAVCE